MRNIYVVLVIFVIFSAASVTAQTITITGQKRIYTRPKPIAKYKKTFTIRRPIARASTPALSRKITAALDPVKILDIDLKEELNEYQWLSEVDFEEIFNQKGILSMSLWMEGSGAYPDGVTKHVVVDTVGGNRLKPSDLFTDIPGLVAAIKKKQEAEIRKAIKDIRADPDWPKDQDPKELFEETSFEEKDLYDFVVDMAGVAFYYDYGFPHVMQALEPEGELRLLWSEVKPFIKKDGLLARFVR